MFVCKHVSGQSGSSPLPRGINPPPPLWVGVGAWDLWAMDFPPTPLWGGVGGGLGWLAGCLAGCVQLGWLACWPAG